MNKLPVILFALSSLPGVSQVPQGDSTFYEQQALHIIYNLQFDDFQKNISTVKSKEAQVLLEIFALRWKEIPVAFSASGKKYQGLLLKNVAALENEKRSNPLLSYYKICTFLFLAEYHSLLDENWAALKWAQKAYPLIIESIDKNLNQPEFQFMKGLYQYYIEFYKQKNILYRAALSPLRSGSITKGIENLKSSAEKTSLAQIEAKIYYSHILMHHENRPWEALPVSRQLTNDFPNNPRFMQLYADNLISCKLYKEAIPLIEQLENQKKEYYSIPAHFFRGIIEEEYFKNKVKAEEEYKFCIESNYDAIEFYKRLATQRLKKL